MQMKALSAARRRFMKIIKDPSLFACRAEVSGDIWKVLVRLNELGQFWIKELKVYVGEGGYEGFPDCRVELRVFKVNPKVDQTTHSKGNPRLPYHVPATLGELRRAAGDIVDCHIIFETLDYAERITWERYCQPEKINMPQLEVKSFRDSNNG
jgi:hypothetical protein